MAGEKTSADATATASAEAAPEAPKKTAQELASEAQAAKAKAELQLFKVTTAKKLGSPQPFQAFALEPGPNHFHGPLPQPVEERFKKLIKAGTITVEVLDGDGKSAPWPPEKTATTN